MRECRVILGLAWAVALSCVSGACRVQPAFPALVTPVVNVPIKLGSAAGSPPPPPTGGGAPSSQGGPVEAGCSFNANQLRGEVGSVFQVACPAHCQDNGGLWGTDVYTGDSAICKAGIHAGVIAPAGGVITLRLDPGRPAYRGSVHHGVASHDHGNYRMSFTILLPPGQTRIAETAVPQAPQVIEAGCSFKANQIRAEVGTASMVSCPAGCASSSGLWGTDSYTGDSGICNAAIHAGVISPAGGTAVIVIDPGRPAYRGSVRNGIKSSDHGNYRLSFHVQRP